MKKFRVVLTCWDFKNPVPYADSVDTLFDSEDAARSAISECVSSELTSLNEGRELVPVCDSDGIVIAQDYDFRADFDGDNDGIIRFWDGDDYLNVTRYNIHPVDFMELEKGKLSEHSCFYRGHGIYSNLKHNRFTIEGDLWDLYPKGIKHSLKAAMDCVDRLELDAELKRAENLRCKKMESLDEKVSDAKAKASNPQTNMSIANKQIPGKQIACGNSMDRG